MCSDSCEIQLGSIADVLEHVASSVRLSRLLLQKACLSSVRDAGSPVIMGGHTEESSVYS